MTLTSAGPVVVIHVSAVDEDFTGTPVLLPAGGSGADAIELTVSESGIQFTAGLSGSADVLDGAEIVVTLEEGGAELLFRTAGPGFATLSGDLVDSAASFAFSGAPACFLQRKDLITKHQFALQLMRDSTVIPNYLPLNPSSHTSGAPACALVCSDGQRRGIRAPPCADVLVLVRSERQSRGVLVRPCAALPPAGSGFATLSGDLVDSAASFAFSGAPPCARVCSDLQGRGIRAPPCADVLVLVRSERQRRGILLRRCAALPHRGARFCHGFGPPGGQRRNLHLLLCHDFLS